MKSNPLLLLSPACSSCKIVFYDYSKHVILIRPIFLFFAANTKESVFGNAALLQQVFEEANLDFNIATCCSEERSGFKHVSSEDAGKWMMEHGVEEANGNRPVYRFICTTRASYKKVAKSLNEIHFPYWALDEVENRDDQFKLLLHYTEGTRFDGDTNGIRRVDEGGIQPSPKQKAIKKIYM